MYIKAGISLLMALVSLLFTGGCLQNPEPPTLVSLKLCEAERSVINAPQYIAATQGFFPQENLRVEIITVGSSEEVKNQVLNRHADIGIASPVSNNFIYQPSGEDYLVHFSQLAKRHGSYLLSPSREVSFEWKNLQSKTIMTANKGKEATWLLEFILEQHGLKDGQDVKILNKPVYLSTAQAFQNGAVDYLVLGEPEATLMEKMKAGYIVSSLDSALDGLPFYTYMAGNNLLNTRPELIQEFCNAIYKAQTWLESHSPQEIALAISPFFPHICLNDLTQIVNQYQQQEIWCITGIIDEEAFNKLQAMAHSTGGIRNGYETSLVINTQFAKKAALLDHP